MQGAAEKEYLILPELQAQILPQRMLSEVVCTSGVIRGRSYLRMREEQDKYRNWSSKRRCEVCELTYPIKDRSDHGTQDAKLLDVMTHACNHNTPEPEAGGLPSAGGQLGCHSVFQSILDYCVKVCLKEK